MYTAVTCCENDAKIINPGVVTIWLHALRAPLARARVIQGDHL